MKIEHTKIIGETAEEKEKNMQKIFRNVFSTPDGKTVLNILLADLKFFDFCNSQEEVALNNYAKMFLINRLGLKDTVTMTDNFLKGEE